MHRLMFVQIHIVILVMCLKYEDVNVVRIQEVIFVSRCIAAALIFFPRENSNCAKTYFNICYKCNRDANEHHNFCANTFLIVMSIHILIFCSTTIACFKSTCLIQLHISSANTLFLCLNTLK